MLKRYELRLFLGLFAVFATLAAVALAYISAERERELQTVLHTASDGLQNTVADASNILREIATTLELTARDGSGSIVNDFQSFVTRAEVIENRPSLVAIAMIAEVPRSRLDSVIQVMTEQEGTPTDAEGRIPFSVSSDGGLEHLNLLISLAPVQRSRKLLGFDLNSSEIRRRTVRHAAEQREVVISERVRLRTAGPGVLVAYPIDLANTPAGERLGPNGTIVTAFATTQLLSELAATLAPYGLAAEVYDIGPAGQAQDVPLTLETVVSSTVLMDLPIKTWADDMLLGNTASATVQQDLSIGGRQWRLVLGRVEGPGLLRDYGVVIAILFAGAIISSLGTFLMKQRLIAESKLEAQVTDRTEALRISEERLKVAIDSSKEGVFDWDILGGTVVFSERNWKLLGYTEEEFGDGFESWGGRLHPDDADATIAAVEDHLERGIPYACEYRIKAADGSWHWWRSRAQALRDADGKATRFIGLNMDVSAEKEQSRLLEVALTRAEAANEAKSRFLATMSHEIRTPMNGIVGMAELLQETDLDSEQRQCTDSIHDSADALLTLINDILDLSKIEAGKINLQQEPVYISRLFDDVAQMLSGAAAEKGVQLLVDDHLNEAIEDQLVKPRWFVTDSMRLRQVLVNIVGNAVKFTGDGRVIVSARLRDGEDGSSASRIEILVSDTGIGIPQEKLEEVFNPFEQADDSISRRFEGSGLGLAISRSLIAAMGGDITVSSSVGHGTTFAISLPAEIADVALSEGEIASRISGKSVVLISGDLDATWVLGMMCDEMGLDVHTCDADQGRLAELPDTIDLAILDLDAGGTRKIQDAAQFMSNDRLKGVPYLLLSNSETRKLANGDNHLVRRKPLRKRNLREAIAELLQLDVVGHGSGKISKTDTPPDYSGCKFLVAEDNKTNRLVMKKMLASTNASLTFVENGLEAVEASAREPFDLILMDVSMPVMNGHEATQKIRQAERQRAEEQPCPIIAVTAHAMPEDRALCEAAGMNFVLTKPIKKQRLFRTVAEALDADGVAEVLRVGT